MNIFVCKLCYNIIIQVKKKIKKSINIILNDETFFKFKQQHK